MQSAKQQNAEQSEVADVTGQQIAAIVSILWDSLKKCPGHPDRRITSVGNKTKLGLARTIKAAIDRPDLYL